MDRELALWLDALAFDDEHGQAGPEAMTQKIAALKASGAADLVDWWLAAGERLVLLYLIRAEPSQ